MSDDVSDGTTDDVTAATSLPTPDSATERGARAPRTAGRRPNRWDRPRPPHDWRWVVGGVGKALITVGMLMFAFVAYQLWGTGIQTAQAQNRLEDRFQEVLATTTVAVEPSSSAVTPATTPATTTTTPATTTTVASTAAPTTTTTAAVVLAPTPQPGDPVAHLQIASIDLDLIVVEGVGRTELQQGPGHFPETPMPGQLGNSAIAGHRTTFGAPFYDIDHLQARDDIVVTTTTGRFVYVVTGQQIVKPSDYSSVIPTVDPTKATLTLTSCHPIRSAAKRIVISAELDATRSDPAVTPPTTAAPPTTTEPAATPAAASPPGSSPVTTIPGDDEAVDAGPVANHDAFGDGWFSDPGAWAQVATWGLTLIVVSVLSYLLMRRARRYWPGLVVGIAPFVVVLYFWFENVNRLLPPNI